MPSIKSFRQRRAIEFFLLNDNQATSRQLAQAAGVTNPPALMSQLACNGWRWGCRWTESVDRDGKYCRYGVYSLLPESFKVAAEMLGK